MAKKQTDSAPDNVPAIPAKGREVIYSILVPNLKGSVAIEAARKAIESAGCSVGLIHVGENSVSVPRLYTFWRGDESERVWQAQIKAALPTAIVDVQDWTPAPGYPQGTLEQEVISAK